MRKKGVVFSKMFVLRSMGSELVPSPLINRHFEEARLLVAFYHEFNYVMQSSVNRGD